MPDFHLVPRFDDSLTYLYVEHVRVDRWESSVALWDDKGITEVPAAALRLLMLGPGTSITHAAIHVLADNNCLVVWCGEEMVRFYAWGLGGTHSARRLLHQAQLLTDQAAHEQVVRRMYAKRFGRPLPQQTSLQQLRGMEGRRVRQTYQQLSSAYGVPWHGRYYDRGKWQRTDPINRAISAANACLYGLCHAAILSAGYSPALGFIHTGKQLSFVYDIADLYKTQTSLPVAFAVTADAPEHLERAVRIAMRDAFRTTRLLERIIPDLHQLLADDTTDENTEVYEEDPARPAKLWMDTRQEDGQ